MVATMPRKGRQRRTAARQVPASSKAAKAVWKEIKWAVVATGALLLLTGVCSIIHLAGVMKLSQVSALDAELSRSIVRLDRDIAWRSASLDALSHPVKVSSAASGQGMMPVEPDTLLDCPESSRMARASDLSLRVASEAR